MRLITFSSPDTNVPRIGARIDKRMLDLSAAPRAGEPELPARMQELLVPGPAALERVHKPVTEAGQRPRIHAPAIVRRIRRHSGMPAPQDALRPLMRLHLPE